MISYREAKITEKIQLIERANSQRESRLRRIAQVKEMKSK
jgi:hypothetical protein